VYRTLNTNIIKYKNFLHEVGRSWISKVQNLSESSSDFNCQRSKQQQGGLKKDLPGRLSGISGYTNLKKCLLVGRETSILQDSVKCVLHIRSKVKLETFVNSALFCFKTGFVLRSTIQ
jgi:hypothetical protein